MITGELDLEYTGEGAILVMNDAGQKTGHERGTGVFVNEIPGAEVFHFQGGLGKEIPPGIGIPFEEHDQTFYKMFVHGTTVNTPTVGTLSIHGPASQLGERHRSGCRRDLRVQLQPRWDHVAFTATETITAPEIYIAHDPLHLADPSIIFDVEGVSLLAGEYIQLDLDPVLEQIQLSHTGIEAENFIVDMKHIWPDGDEQDYAKTIHLPADKTSAFIDFGAWDGLLEPHVYIDSMLQNPSVNHRLMVSNVTGAFHPELTTDTRGMSSFCGW